MTLSKVLSSPSASSAVNLYAVKNTFAFFTNSMLSIEAAFF